MADILSVCPPHGAAPQRDEWRYHKVSITQQMQPYATRPTAPIPQTVQTRTARAILEHQAG
eukprot:21564-Eustigmatos_ZCMA.PRE.1